MLAAFQTTGVDWNTKPINLPADRKRVHFAVYLPKADSSFKVQRSWIVWIPKLKQFPELPARQAIRYEIKDENGKALNVFQSPAMSDNAWADNIHLISQGYLSYRLKVGTSLVAKQRGKTCVGIAGSSYSAQALYTIIDELVLTELAKN